MKIFKVDKSQGENPSAPYIGIIILIALVIFAILRMIRMKAIILF